MLHISLFEWLLQEKVLMSAVSQGWESLLLAVLRLLLLFQRFAIHHFHSVHLSMLQATCSKDLEQDSAGQDHATVKVSPVAYLYLNAK